MLAGILMIVAYDMGEWREIPEVVKLGPAEAAVWCITFALTVFADLTVAVEAGMILAALLYIRRVTTTTTVALVTPEYIRHGRAHSLQLQRHPGRRRHLPHSRTVSLRQHRQAARPGAAGRRRSRGSSSCGCAT